MPSMSTGGAATKAIMKHVVAVSNAGIINTPNHPTYRRLFVDVTQLQNFSQLVVVSLCSEIAAIFILVMNDFLH